MGAARLTAINLEFSCGFDKFGFQSRLDVKFNATLFGNT
jgi:hypothetical protein